MANNSLCQGCSPSFLHEPKYPVNCLLVIGKIGLSKHSIDLYLVQKGAPLLSITVKVTWGARFDSGFSIILQRGYLFSGNRFWGLKPRGRTAGFSFLSWINLNIV